MDLNELDNLSKRIAERCMPGEDKEEVGEKQKFLDALTIWPILSEIIKVALIPALATVTNATVTAWVKKNKDDKIKETKDKIKDNTLKILEAKGIEGDSAELMAIKIADAAEAEFNNLS
ncbi:MAG: hypothetical protein ACYSWS_06350 [Planctomycetota bacterium]|jgi:malate/lactate dehydrogenase